MTVAQRAELAARLAGHRHGAAPEFVLALARITRQPLADMPPVLRRLLDVEDELAATRNAIARHAAAADAGDDPAPCDLLADLDRAGHGIDETALDIARALHAAEAVTRW
ncbi:hypothetical protein ACWGRF_01925 [Streptomyces zhihengii]